MSTTASLQILANDIALGFDALLERLDEHKKVEAVLKEQLSRGSDRVCTHFSFLVSLRRMLQPLALDLSSFAVLKDR